MSNINLRNYKITLMVMSAQYRLLLHMHRNKKTTDVVCLCATWHDIKVCIIEVNYSLSGDICCYGKAVEMNQTKTQLTERHDSSRQKFRHLNG